MREVIRIKSTSGPGVFIELSYPRVKSCSWQNGKREPSVEEGFFNFWIEHAAADGRYAFRVILFELTNY